MKTITHDGSVLLITDENVARFHLDFVLSKIEAPKIHTMILPSGERTKCFETIEKIIDFALQNGLDRHSLMISLGGGVVSDIVGFASGIFMRGIEFVSIPTTLLAQVDASVGGKCGINNKFGKNLIGLFNEPKQIILHTPFLDSLPDREFRAGIAEIIKIAVCFDKEFFYFLQKNNFKSNLEYIVEKSVNLKQLVVSQDKLERGIRKGLNYGHTFGHVIENTNGYGKYLHGEAVSIGMVMANELAYKLGIFKEGDEIKNMLCRFGLPTSYTIDDVDGFFDKLRLDKKTKNSTKTFILPNKIGSFLECSDIHTSVIVDLLKNFGRSK